MTAQHRGVTMLKTKLKIIATVAALTASVLVAGIQPAAAEYPDSPVQFVVPWPPGDFEDILTRMIAKEMETQTGVSTSVVNKPGGGDGPFPGALEVLNGPNDGSMVGSMLHRVRSQRSLKLSLRSN